MDDMEAAFPIEGDLNAQRYVIVDDLQSSGKTITAIVEGISLFNPDARCLGILLYKDPLASGSPVHINTSPRNLPALLHKFVYPDPEQFLLNRPGEKL